MLVHRRLIYLVLCPVLCPVLAGYAHAQDVFVNEMSQGSDSNKEWVELLVRTGHTDLRGWELGDNDDGVFTAIVAFTAAAAWADVAHGTIIVIYNGADPDAMLTAAGAPDTDFADGLVLIPHDDPTFFTDAPGGWGASAFSNADADDAPALRDAADVLVHDLAAAHPSAAVSAPGTGEAKYFTSDLVAGLGVGANWVEVASTAATPGALNPGQSAALLPVELASFEAIVDGADVHLRWTTASETNNAGFEVQRRDTGREGDGTPEAWASFAFVAGAGTTAEARAYHHHAGALAPGRYVFRLRQVDYDGSSRVLPSVAVVVAPPSSAFGADLYPNPFAATVHLRLAVPRPQVVRVRLLDPLGRVVRTLFSGPVDSSTPRLLRLEADGLASGTYLCSIEGETFRTVRAVTVRR